MTTMWNSFTATAVALAPGRIGLGNARFTPKQSAAPGVPASPSQSATQAALCLALDDAMPGHLPDFIFRRPPAERGQIEIWHPDPRCHGRLDQLVLATMLEAMAAGQIGDAETAAQLQEALSGDRDIRNLEVSWRDDVGTNRCWQLSTRYARDSDEADSVIGLVRDVSAAQSHCEQISTRLASVATRDRAATRTATSIANAVREQALLISSICDLLAEPTHQVASDEECRRHDFVTDVRQAVRQIVINAELLRDYNHAREGTLRLIPQRWSAAELLSVTAPLLSDLLAGTPVSVKVQPPAATAELLCDPYKLARFLMLEMAPLCAATAPGSTARLGAHAAPGEGIAIVLDCQTKTRGASTGEGGVSEPLVAGPMHPELSKHFHDCLLTAHDADVETTSSAQGSARMVIRLSDLVQAGPDQVS